MAAELEARRLRPRSTEREYEIVLQREPQGSFSVFVPEFPSLKSCKMQLFKYPICYASNA